MNRPPSISHPHPSASRLLRLLLSVAFSLWAYTSPAFTPPSINEIMPLNTATIEDPSDGKFDPWIELYNPNNTPLDLSGWKLEDHYSQTWEFPPNTSIPSQSFLLVWMDGDTQQPGHADFSLFNGPNGGTLTLRDAQGNSVSSQSYGQLAPDQSQGKFPDGSQSNYLIKKSSPNAPNTLLPTIVSQPQSRITSPGKDINETFCVGAIGSGALTYQWRHNGINIPGETNDCYTIFNVQIADGGSYSALVFNSLGTILSDPAILQLDIPLLPARDSFEDALNLIQFPTLQGDNSDATREPDEPAHFNRPGNHSVWFGFEGFGNGILTINTKGSTFDTLLAVYTGDSVDNLTEVTSDDDSGGFHTSHVQFNVEDGIAYSIAVDGLAGSSGIYVLNWSLEETDDKVPLITQHPQSQTVLPGQDAFFSVSVSDEDVSYQWMRNGNDITGETDSTLFVPSVTQSDVDHYNVRLASPDSRFTISLPASLQVGTDPDFLARNKFFDLLPDGSGDGGGSPGDGSGGGSPSSFRTPSLGPGSIGSHNYSNRRSDTDPGEIPSCGIRGGASDWFQLHMTNNATCIIDTSGSDIDTVIAVFRKTSSVFGLVTNEIVCNSSLTPGTAFSRVRFDAVADTDYLVAIDGVDGALGNITMNWSVGLAPVITNNTAIYLKLTESSLSLRAWPADDTFPITYQWHVNGSAIPTGIHRQALHLSNIQFADVGHYSVIASNLFGTTTHPIAELGVIQITPIRIGSSIQMEIEGRANPSLTLDRTTRLSPRDWTPLFRIPPDGRFLLSTPPHPPNFYRLRQD